MANFILEKEFVKYYLVKMDSQGKIYFSGYI